MTTPKIILLVIVPFILCGCNSNGSKNIEKLSDTVLTKQDPANLLAYGNKKYSIASIQRDNDTLSIVIASRIIYHPFGKAYQINGLKGVDPHFTLKELRTQDKYTGQSVMLFKLYYKDSYVKFFRDGESQLLEMTSAKIIDRELVLPENIRIGMEFADFIGLYFGRNISNRLPAIKVVKLISGLDGIWENYTFQEGKLISIYIKTDYTFKEN